MRSAHLQTLTEPGGRIELTFADGDIVVGTWGYSVGDTETAILLIDNSGAVYLVNLNHVRSVYVPKEVK
jgi:hypothetical protein